MTMYRELKVHVNLTSALDGGEWPPSRPGRITPQERFDGHLSRFGLCGEEKYILCGLLCGYFTARKPTKGRFGNNDTKLT